MNDKVKLYLDKMLKNLDKVILVFEAFLLFAVFIIYSQDKGTIVEEPTPPSAKPLETIVPNDNYKNVYTNFVKEPKLENDEEMRSLQEYNMFDFKTVRDRETYMKEWDDQFRQADQLYKSGKAEEAYVVVKKILQHWPGHLKAKELKKVLDDKFKPTPTPTPTPSPVPPPGAGGPGGAPGEPGAPNMG